MDLTPRTSGADGDPASVTNNRAKSLRSFGLIGLIVVALGFVVVRGLGDATLFFYNADEAVERRDELTDRRFRLQGEVLAGSVTELGTSVSFVVTHEGVEVPVRHTGTPPELFQPGIPVVLEGRWSEADHFTSDSMLVKHSEEYVADNGERVDDYEAP